MSRLSTSRDERGAALPLVALILVTLMTCAALAVDVGSVAATNRKLQGVADLAASAGALELSGDACNFNYKLSSETTPKSLFNRVREAAVANAEKNGFSPAGTRTLVVEVGVLTYDNGTGEPRFTTTHSTLTGADCMVSSVPAAVRVTAGDYTRFVFGQVIGQKGQYTQRRGTSGRKSHSPCTGSGCGSDVGFGAFDIGSSVASLNTANSPVLTSVLNGMVCRGVSGCSFNTTLVGYQGLATAGVTLGQLQGQLGAGSVSSLLDMNLKISDLYLASAKALGCTTATGCSNTAAVTLFGLWASLTSGATCNLRNIITFASGS